MSYQNPKFGTNLGLPINIFRRLTPTDKRTGGWLNLKGWVTKVLIEYRLIDVDPCCSTAIEYGSINSEGRTAGIIQTTASPINAQYFNVGTSSFGQGVILPTNFTVITVTNSSINTINVYPFLGGTINGGTVNAAITINANEVWIFSKTSNTDVTAMLIGVLA